MLAIFHFFLTISFAAGDSSINFLAVGDWGGQQSKLSSS
jgi:hypothetical protein